MRVAIHEKVLTPLLILLTGCTFTVSTAPPKKQVKPAAYGRHSSHHTAKPRVTQQINSANIKETWWIENYHKLEDAKGNYTIPADERIVPLPDGRFKVPEEVLKHYQDLLLAKPSPEAKP